MKEIILKVMREVLGVKEMPSEIPVSRKKVHLEVISLKNKEIHNLLPRASPPPGFCRF